MDLWIQWNSTKVLRWSENRERLCINSKCMNWNEIMLRHSSPSNLCSTQLKHKHFSRLQIHVRQQNSAKPKHKSSIQSGDRQKLNRYFMEGQKMDGVWRDGEKLVEFIRFLLCFHFARWFRLVYCIADNNIMIITWLLAGNYNCVPCSIICNLAPFGRKWCYLLCPPKVMWLSYYYSYSGEQ